MAVHKVRCAECAYKITLLGNVDNCWCSVSNKIEPLYEHLVCGDFKLVKRSTDKKG